MRRIVSAKINFLSLVPRGANQLPVIYKADDNSVTLNSLVKASDGFDEKGELLSVVYAPEMVDSQGDIASGETIKQMMYDAAKEGLDLDIRHDGKALSKEDAFVAESFIIQKGDERFKDMKNYDGKPVDVTGGWATVIKIDNEDLRKEYREGKWNGVSMAGTAEFTQEKQDLDGFVSKLKDLINNNPSDSGDFDMKPEELNKILEENNKAIVKSIKEALKPEAPEGDGNSDEIDKADDCPVKKPVLKNATDPKAVAEYQKELKAYSLAKSVDWEDPDAVAEYHKAISEEDEDEPSDKDAGIEKDDSEEVASLKKQLAKAQRRSNAAVSKDDNPSAGQTATIAGFSKEDASLLETGRKAGQAHTKQMGY